MVISYFHCIQYIHGKIKTCVENLGIEKYKKWISQKFFWNLKLISKKLLEIDKKIPKFSTHFECTFLGIHWYDSKLIKLLK